MFKLTKHPRNAVGEFIVGLFLLFIASATGEHYRSFVINAVLYLIGICGLILVGSALIKTYKQQHDRRRPGAR